MRAKFGVQREQQFRFDYDVEFRGRELPAPPGARSRGPLRRQHLPADDQGAGLTFDPGALNLGGDLAAAFAESQREVPGAGFHPSDWRFFRRSVHVESSRRWSTRGANVTLRADSTPNSATMISPDDAARISPRAAHLRGPPSRWRSRMSAVNGTASRPRALHCAEWIPAGSRILDLGCGDGTLLRTCTHAAGAPATAWRSNPDKHRAVIAAGVKVIESGRGRGFEGIPRRQLRLRGDDAGRWQAISGRTRWCRKSCASAASASSPSELRTMARAASR